MILMNEKISLNILQDLIALTMFSGLYLHIFWLNVNVDEEVTVIYTYIYDQLHFA